VGQAEPQLRQEVGSGQIPFEAVPLGTVRIENEDRRRPLGVETLEHLRLLLGVGTVRDEVFRDERRDLGIGVDLGIQPSACPSHRGGAEVEKHRPAGLGRFAKRCVDVSLPCDFHEEPPLSLRGETGSNSRAGEGRIMPTHHSVDRG
jgi:hypothetical protein